MKYFFRLITYLIIFFLTFTLVSVVLLKFVPVSFTPLKVVALKENRAKENVPLKTQWVPLSRISREMVTAVVSTEDNNFLNHNGFDFTEIRKAVEENKKGRRLRGASTISQQTAKNVFCIPSRSWFRKAVETWFTFWIEWVWGKKRIMEVYLNVIETHPNVYGAEASARTFYNKPASGLNRYEAAMIATVLPSPRRMNLASPSDYMNKRSSQVRRMMQNTGTVDFENRPSSKEQNKKK